MKKFERDEIALAIVSTIHHIEDSLRTIKRVQDELSKDFTADGAVLSYNDMVLVSMIANASLNLEFVADSLKGTYEGYWNSNDQTGQSEEES